MDAPALRAWLAAHAEGDLLPWGAQVAAAEAEAAKGKPLAGRTLFVNLLDMELHELAPV